MSTGYANGLIPASAMTALSVGGMLLGPAAGNFELLRAAAARDGFTVTITSAADAFRTYAVQERIFRERYTTTYLAGRPTKVWNGRTYWLRPGMATAAVPGKSNHGYGIAVDIASVGGFGSRFYAWLLDNAPLYGWSNAEGRSIGEAWHWVNDNRARGAVGGAVGIIPGGQEEDDDMDANDKALLVQIHSALYVPGQPFGWLSPMNDKLDGIARKLGEIVEQIKGVDTSVSNTNRNMIERLDVPGAGFGYPAATHNAVGSVLTEIAALRAAVSAIASSSPGETPDLDAVFAAARDGAAEGLKGFTFRAVED